MCMEKEILMEIGGTIGKVEEVETDASGDVMGQIIRLRVSVDITKPLTKVILLQTQDEEEADRAEGQTEMQEDTQGAGQKEKDQILITVQYEKLPEFCFCCGCIRHQYKECVAYKNQARDDLPYGPWTKAQTTTESWKQRRNKGRQNTEAETTRDQSPNSQGELHQNNTESQPPKQVENLDPKERLIQTREHSNTKGQPLPSCEEMRQGSDSCQKQQMTVTEVNIDRGDEIDLAIPANAFEDGKKRETLEKGKNNGGKVEREGDCQNVAQEENKGDGEANGLTVAIIKPKRRKWKMQARGENKSENMMAEKQYGLGKTKRPASDATGESWTSPEVKRRKLSGQTQMMLLSSPRVT